MFLRAVFLRIGGFVDEAAPLPTIIAQLAVTETIPVGSLEKIQSPPPFDIDTVMIPGRPSNLTVHSAGGRTSSNLTVRSARRLVHPVLRLERLQEDAIRRRRTYRY